MTLTELKEWKSTIISEIDRFGVDRVTVMNEILKIYETIDEDDLMEELDVIITNVLVNGPKKDLGEINRERAAKNMGSKWSNNAA